MTAPEFELILSSRIDKIKSVLASKAKEYATGADRLHNFRIAAEFLNETPSQACLGFMAKHLVSVADMVAADAEGKPPSVATVDEKIGDAINYLILLEAILRERIGTNQEAPIHA